MGGHRNGNIFQKSDHINIIRGINRDVTADFSAIERQSTKIGLAVNENKIKYMLSTVRRINSHITADNYNFYTVNEFIYIGYAFTTKNNVSLEIKRRITLANRCYYDLNG